MKKKNTDYLPLHWVKKAGKFDSEFGNTFTNDSERFRKLFLQSLDKDNVNAVDLNKWFNAYESFLTDHKELLLSVDNTLTYCDSHNDYTNFAETLQDFNFLSLVMLWSKNKQVFKLDKDFTEELLNTEDIKLPVDVFDYLPFEYFYVDLSNCKELREKTLCEGFFCTVQKFNYGSETFYYLSMVRVDNEFFYVDTVMIDNNGESIKTTKYEDSVMVNLVASEEGDLVYRGDKEFNQKLFNTLVIQLLLYLSSVEPDMEKSVETRYTYRKPTNGVIKNKFSEVFMWDVGVHFGNSVRDWKKKNKNHSNSSTGTGSPKRPHMRRAHWHSYYYNTPNGNREKRLVWLKPIFVNKDLVKNDDEISTTIHETSLFD